ncbi:unnamed protein product [Ceutorhynchus assimilis]|uniref:Transcriptional regulator ATRX n=1 Tax=Ceutorhynchus assimilis TaxID=467358 RepID=A0A9N9QPT6_9CUCU|nr:unnamed protein product [Ceutorhynchus assimilis]
MEPMEIELLLVLKNLAQDVRHFLLRQKNEADKCIADFDKTHDKQKLCHKLAIILCEINASNIQHARAIKNRIKDFGEEDEFDTTIKKLEDLLSESSHETNHEKIPIPITNKQLEELQLSQCNSPEINHEENPVPITNEPQPSQCNSHKINHEDNPIPITNEPQLSQISSVHLDENLSQTSTAEYTIEGDGQEILDSLPKEINSQDTNISPNSVPIESYNPDPNMTMPFSESDFDVEELISYDHISQGSSAEENISNEEDMNLDTTVTEVAIANLDKVPSGDVDVEATKQVSDVAIDQDKDADTPLPSCVDSDAVPDNSTKVSDDQNKAKSDEVVATGPQVSSVSVDQDKTKLISGADERDSDVDFDASTDVPSDASDQDKLVAAESDTEAAKTLPNVESDDRALIEEELRQESVNNDGDISASDSSNEVQGQSKKRQKISNKAKMAIFKVISEFVRKKREQGKNSNSNSDTKEQDSNSGDKPSTKKKRKRRKKTDQKASTSKEDKVAIQTNGSSSDIDNRTSPDNAINKKDNEELTPEKTRLEDTDSDKTEISDTAEADHSEAISPFKKKTIKPLPPTSSDSENIFTQKKSAAIPLPSSNTEDSDASVPIPSLNIDDTEPVRGTKSAAVPLPSSSTEDSDAAVPIPSLNIDDTEPVRGTKSAAVPLPSSSTEDSDAAVPIPSLNIDGTEPARGTKRLLSSSDDSGSEPSKKISADNDGDVDFDAPTQVLDRPSTTPDEDGDSITPSDDTMSNKKRKISEASNHSIEFNLDDQDSLIEFPNSPDKNKSSEEESRPEESVAADVPIPEIPSDFFSEDKTDLLNMLDDKEKAQNALQGRTNQDRLLNLGSTERNLLDLYDRVINAGGDEESSENDDGSVHDDRLLSAGDVLNSSPEEAPKRLNLDNAERDELLDLLSETYQEYQIEDGQRTDTNGVNRGFLLGILNDYVQTISNRQGSDSNSVFLDVIMEEIAQQGSKKPTDDEEIDDSLVWDTFYELMHSEDDSLSSSSLTTDIDLDDLEIDFSDQERRAKKKEKINILKQDFGINKELHIDVEQIDVSPYIDKVLKKTAKKMDDDSCMEDSTEIERLCNIANLAKKKVQRKRFARYHTVSPSSSSCRSRSNDSRSESNDSRSESNDSLSGPNDSLSGSNASLSVRYDSDTYLSDNDVPLLNDDQSNDDIFHTYLIDKIINSSDDEQSRNDSDDEYDSSDNEKTKKKILTKKNKKKKDVNSSGSEIENAQTDTEVKDLDSSDEEDFVGVRKSRGLWRNDPLLESDSDTDDENSKKNKKKRININWDDAHSDDMDRIYQKTPDEDSGDDCRVLNKTPMKPIVITDDESSSKKNTGRRNIKPLMEDNALSISTQVANSEERARIKRLQERDEEKELLYSITNNTCNIEEEDPLILDTYKNKEVRIHPKITATLKAHQRRGIQFMWDSCYESIKQLEKGWGGSGCILAHCMGLGKTLQALALIHVLFNCALTKTKHVLVVCPLSTVSNWKNEFKLAYQNIRNPNVKLFTIENDGDRRFRIVQNWYKTGGLLVLGYECFSIMIDEKKWLKWGKKGLGCFKDDIFKALVDPGPDLVICDEGHLLRNKQTQRTMALNKVKTKRRIVLTGTPLQNNLLEYYYMVHFVKPNLLGTEKEFKTNFVNPISNGQFEDSTADDIMFMKKRTHVLHKILNKTVQRVEDSELKQYLPNFTDQALFVKLSDLQVNLYNAYLDMVNSRPVVFTRAGEISRANFLGDIQILRYICQHPDVVTIAEKTSKLKIKEQDVIDDVDYIEEVKAFDRNGWYKDLLPKEGTKKLEKGSKMMTVVNLVKEAAEVGDKVLIFAQAYAEMDNLEWFLCNHLKFRKGHDYYRMDGLIKPERRADMCNSFNCRNALKVFIMSTKVGGLGLNLTAANRVILMNVNWNPSYDIQSVFRVFRFGQTKPVYVYRLIAMDTMEEKMYQRQVTKLAIAHRVVDKHQITRHYSAADIQEFYSVRPTIAGVRPVPNVPEDRVLAKLLQKHKFIYRWHEHQALLANRPEEDLDELQKNAAWEEFNRKPDSPPPFTAMGEHPNFWTASAVLAGPPNYRLLGPQHPGPSGLLVRPPGMSNIYARPSGQNYGPIGLRPGPSGQYPGTSGQYPVPPLRLSGPSPGVQFRPLNAISASQPRPSFVPVNPKLNAVRQNLINTHFPDHSYSLPKDRPAHFQKKNSYDDFYPPRIRLSKSTHIYNASLNTKQIIVAPLNNLASQQSSLPRIINSGNNTQNVRPTVVASQQLPSSSINNFDNNAQNIVANQQSSSSRINNFGNVVQNIKANVPTKTTVINFGKVVQNSRPTAALNQNVSVGNGGSLSLENPTKAPFIPPPTSNKQNLTKKRDREPEKPNTNDNLTAKRPKLDPQNLNNSNKNSTINLSDLSPVKAGDSLEQKIANAINDVKKINGKNARNVTQATLPQTNQINNNSLVQNINKKSQKVKIQPNTTLTTGYNKSANERSQNIITQKPENGPQLNKSNIIKATPFKKLPPGSKPPISAKIINVKPTNVFGGKSPVILADGIDLTSPPPPSNQQQSPQMRERVRSSLDHLRKLQQLEKAKTSPDLKDDPKLVAPNLPNFQQNPIGPPFPRIIGMRQGSPGSPSTLSAAKNLTFAHTPQISAVAASTSSQSPKSQNVRTSNGSPLRRVPLPSKINVNGIPVTLLNGANTSPKVVQSGRANTSPKVVQSGRANTSPKVVQSGHQRNLHQQEQQSIPMRFSKGQTNAKTLQRQMTNNLNKIIRLSTISGSPPISSQPSNTTKANLQSNKKPVGELVSAASLPILNQLPSTPTEFKSNKENRSKRKSYNNNAEENQSPGSSAREQLFSDLKKKGFNISPVKKHNPINKDVVKKD